MVKSHLSFLITFFTIHLIVMKRFLGSNAATCNGCFTHSRAVYYPNSDEKGTETGACGFGEFGATINNGLVSAASNLYRDGVGCGACYQVKCTNKYYCSDKGVTVAITDHGYSGNADFILSRKAFRRMAFNKHSAESILAFGVVNIEYRRVSCNYENKNITIKIDENSNYPYYLAFILRHQQGKKDITAIQICETRRFVCKLLERSYGAVWAIVSPPRGPLSVRMLVKDEENNDDDNDDHKGKWLVPRYNIPSRWKPGHIYDSGVQIDT